MSLKTFVETESGSQFLLTKFVDNPEILTLTSTSIIGRISDNGVKLSVSNGVRWGVIGRVTVNFCKKDSVIIGSEYEALSISSGPSISLKSNDGNTYQLKLSYDQAGTPGAAYYRSLPYSTVNNVYADRVEYPYSKLEGGLLPLEGSYLSGDIVDGSLTNIKILPTNYYYLYKVQVAVTTDGDLSTPTYAISNHLISQGIIDYSDSLSDSNRIRAEYIGEYYLVQSLYGDFSIPDIVHNTISTDATDFYRTKPVGDIAVNRGETVNLEFSLIYSDGTTEVFTDILYEHLPDKSVATFSDNSFTISENCRASQFDFIAKPNIEDTDLFSIVFVRINNPVNPYLPDDGGVSGGGAQSGSSNVIGSFDGTPGPSIVSGIPDGAVGSDIASSGMYTKYLCDAGILNVIAQYLWEDNVGIQALKAIIGNPIDSIISLISYPFALDSLVPVTSTKIYFGKYNSLLSASAITKSSLQIDWGTIEIPFFWGGFLDYSPYTQIQLYLPWGVGFVSLDPNEVMPWSSKNSYTQGSFTKGSVSVVTNIELDKGSCLHNVIGNNGRIIGSFGGICGKQVPVVGTNDAARTLALIGAAVSAGTTLGMAATGQPALGKGLAYGKNMSQMNRAEGREMLADYNSAVSGMLASSKAAAKSPPTYPRAGTFSDATSHLSVQYPYLIISRPSQSIPKQYGRFMGYPSNIFHNHLGEVKGYTEVSSIHLDDIPATSTELDELESILKGGVLL